MRTHKILLFLVSVTAFALLLLSACEKDEIIKSDTIVYSLDDEIINPPDTFKILFPIYSQAAIGTTVLFDSSSSWLIQRMSAYTASVYYAPLPDTTPITYIPNNYTLEVESETEIHFMASKSQSTTFQNLILLFSKTSE